MSTSPDPHVSRWVLFKEAIRGSDRDFARLDLRTAVPLLAIPMVLEMGMESVFALVDVYFVSRLGANEVAAVGMTESVITVNYAVAIGLSMAVTALVARRFGEGDRTAAARVAGQALVLAVVLGVCIGGPAAVQAGGLLRLVGADERVATVGRDYAAVTFASSVIITVLFALNAVFRGAGAATYPMRTLWIANTLNIVLDPLLIFGVGPFPELGVTGAAVATTVGRSVGVGYQLWCLFRRCSLHVDRDCLRPNVPVLRELVRVSIGGVGQTLVGTASWIALVRILSAFGAEVVAGYTIAIRFVLFSLLPAMGFANATATLVGQSLGAGDPARAQRAVWMSGLYTMIFLGAVCVVFIAIPEAIAGLVTDDPAVRGFAGSALRIIAYGYVFYAWQLVLLNAFNGAGDTGTPTRLGLVAFWLVEIPGAWLLAQPMGYGPQGVFAAIAISYSFAAALAYVTFRRGRWKTVRI